MKRKRLALLLALAMTVTSLPANSLIVSAAEETDGFMSANETGTEVESNGDDLGSFMVGDTVEAENEIASDTFEGAESENGFTSASEDTAETEEVFQETEEQQATDELASPQGIEMDRDLYSYEVEYQERVELHSSACSTDDSELTYQWYVSGWNDDSDSKVQIEGATGTDYVIESAEQSKRYYCIATDVEGETSTERFEVCVNNIEFTREEDAETVTVKLHGQVVLKSTAYSLVGADLEYKWSKWNKESYTYDAIEGANAETLTINDVTSVGEYRCQVTDGACVSGEIFVVSIDSGLASKDEEDYFEIKLEMGETTTLSPSVIADDGVTFSYQWFEEVYNGQYYNEVEISGATNSELMVGPLDGRKRYVCRVSDPYENNIRQYFDVSLKDTLQIEGEKWKEIQTELNGTVELTVQAASKLSNELTYKWYRNDEKAENGSVEIKDNEGKTTLKVENINQKETYYCRIEDGNETAWVYFEIEINTGLKIDHEATQTDFDVDYGQPVSMELFATANPDVELSYQWYEYDEEWEPVIIPGATQKSYTIDKAEVSKIYLCEVTDNYGGSIGQEFDVQVSRIIVDNEGMQVYIEQGEDTELIVSARSVLGENLTYEWFKRRKGETEYTQIEGATSNKLILTGADAAASYNCKIKDSKTSALVWFEVLVDTCIIFKNRDTEMSGKAGSKVILDSEAFAETGVDLTYQWYKEIVKYDENQDEYYDYEMIKGANSATYEATVTQNYETYMCEVKDSLGNTAQNYLGVSKESGFLGGETKHIVVKPGENVTLKTDITEDTSKKLSYQWCYYNEQGAKTVLDGAITDSYEVKNVLKTAEYFCVVGYEGDTGSAEVKRQYFDIEVESGFVLESDSDVTLNVKSGTKNVALDVAAKSNSDLSYEWYKYVEDEDLEVYWTKIDGASGKSYIVDCVKESWSSYKCKVSDKYNSMYVYFTINAYPEIAISTEENVWVAKGSDATLSVKVTAGANCEKISYKWYKYINYGNKGGWSQIKDAEGTSYTVKSVNNLQKYRCEVSDDYGCSIVADILVGPDTLKQKTAVEFEDAITLEPGIRRKVSLELPGMYQIYKFVPDRSGIWQIRSISDGMISGLLCDDQKNLLVSSNLDVRYSGDFKIEYNLEKGKTYYLECGRSEHYSKRSFLIEANYVREATHEHQWDGGRIKVEAGCGTPGSKVYTCTVCGQTKEETIAATGQHIMVKKVDKAAACGTAGSQHKECSVCGVREAETAIPATGQHTMVTKVDKAATCGVAGSQHKECSVCGAKEAATVIPATGKHSYSEYTVTKEATAVAEGTKVRTCSVCGASDSAVIAKIPGTIQVTAAKVPLQIKKSVALSKLVSGFASGDSINAVACTSSKSDVAAIVNGTVKAKKTGTTVVTIKLVSGVSAQVMVTVQKKAVATTSVNVVKNVTLVAGEKQKLTPVISPITTLNKVTYSSTNKKVATVSKDGTITAKKSGTATIKVKSGKKTVKVKVKVTAKAPTGMTGVPATKTLKKGKSFTLKAKLTPSGSEAKITYKSSNNKVVSVSAKGKVKAKKKGTATITVKAGNVTKTCVVTVK